MKIPVPEQKIEVYATVIPMRWGDMDAYGHMNNTSYLRFFEEARVQWLAVTGRELVENGQGPVVANIFCNYYRELNYPCDVLIKMYVSEPGRSSIDTWMTMERTDQPDVVYADGGATMVWVDFNAKKAVALPPWLKELIAEAAAA